MSTAELKTDINKMLKEITDVRVIKGIHAMVKEVSSEEIIGYSISGKPFSKKDLIQKTMKAENDIKNGRTYTTSEIVSCLKTQRNRK